MLTVTWLTSIFDIVAEQSTRKQCLAVLHIQAKSTLCRHLVCVEHKVCQSHKIELICQCVLVLFGNMATEDS